MKIYASKKTVNRRVHGKTMSFETLVRFNNAHLLRPSLKVYDDPSAIKNLSPLEKNHLVYLYIDLNLLRFTNEKQQV